MNATPVVAVTAAAAVGLVPPLRRRVVPVAKSMGRAGMGVGTALVAGVSDVVGTAVRGRPGLPPAPAPKAD